MVLYIKMEDLPEVLIHFIIEFLEISEIFSICAHVCKLFNSIISSEYFLNSILSHQIFTKKKISLVPLKSLRNIRKLYRHKSFKALEYQGFGTTGGVDDDLSCYWVSNLFKKDPSSYCSRIGQNVNCVGVLQSTQKKLFSRKQLELRQIAAEIIRNNQILNTISQVGQSELSSDLLPIEERLFIEAWEENRDLLEISAFAYPSVLKNKIYKWLKASQFNVKSFSKGDQNVLIKEIDHAEVQTHQVLACFDRVVISRNGEYSCPLSVFIVFVSDEYIDISSSAFEVYNGVHTFQDLVALTEMEKTVPRVQPLESSNSFEFSRFKKTRNDLKPLVWGRFKSKRKEVTTIELGEIFSGKYLYAKLISSDNFMSEFHDFHQETNIDCTYIGLRGTEIRLN